MSVEKSAAEALSVAELLRRARLRLGGGDRAMPDAEALLGCVTGMSAASLIAGASRIVAGSLAGEFRALVERRAGGEPLAYLRGWQEFWSLQLRVTPEVLIPRPETELLVELALAHVRAQASHHRAASLLELGTGSGAIALALAAELPGRPIVATDNSPAAIAVAEHNRRQLEAGRAAPLQIEFRVGDWFQAIPSRRFDIIVANPPYIAPNDEHLRRGGLRFEPSSALVSQDNGLADLARIIAQAPFHLTGGGALLLEHGCDQAAAVRALFAGHGFTAISTHPDLAGHERVTQGRCWPAGVD